MKYTIVAFNDLPKAEIRSSLLNCCASHKWVERMIEKIPFENESDLFNNAITVWANDCDEADWKEAFAAHPRIGSRKDIVAKSDESNTWASNEQAGMDQADSELKNDIASNNRSYFDKNGFIYLVCASSKSAEELAVLLEQRLKHSTAEELHIAAGEQSKITLLRLQKTIELHDPIWNKVSHVTTHVLDTSLGKPGQKICIRLKELMDQKFVTIAIGLTNADGRVTDLLPPDVYLVPGHYQMCFDTGAYFEAQELTGFYPKVDIDFTVFDNTHYHVPLLINPFGYSTYRGS